MKKLLLALPVIVLLALTMQRAYDRYQGRDIILDIRGYDPVDIFAGHYLTYSVDYKIDELCQDYNLPDTNNCVCFTSTEPVIAEFHGNCQPEKCLAYLNGKCKWGFFEAGIERFYIPEEQSGKFDKKLRKEGAKIRVSVSSSGHGIVKELIWK